MKQAALLFPLLALACRDPSASNTPAGPELPIDAARGITVEQALGWKHRQTSAADLNGDGSAEQVVLTSDVVVSERGDPLWEDGHRWALVVSERGTPTLLYAAFVPRGFVEAAVTPADSTGARRLLLQERTPEQLRTIELTYVSPGSARATSTAWYPIESWLPGSARLSP